jgi:hypothetical protein
VIEYTVVVFSVLLAMFTCVQIALYSYARSVALTAAEAGVNAQRAYGAQDDAGKKAAYQVIDSQQDTLESPGVFVQPVGGEIQVHVTGTTQSVLFHFFGFSVSETATGPIERFRR